MLEHQLYNVLQQPLGEEDLLTFVKQLGQLRHYSDETKS